MYIVCEYMCVSVYMYNTVLIGTFTIIKLYPLLFVAISVTSPSAFSNADGTTGSNT